MSEITQPKTSVLTALKFAFRESRATFQNFKIFIASLFLGTAIIAGVGSVTSNVSDSIKQDSQKFLGGDLEISQIQKRLTDEQRAYLSDYGKISEVATLRTMAHAGNDSSLVDLKAVDGLYPLYGELELQEDSFTPDMMGLQDGHWGILLSDALATRLNLIVGSSVKLGTKNYTVRGIIKTEPDANNQGFQLAPGAMISFDSLLDNSLVQPGSLVRYYNRIKLDDITQVQALTDEMKKIYPDEGWRIRNGNSGGNGLRRFIGRLGQFMTLVGLTALLVGGVGVSNAVRAYLNSKTETIATYKILGGTAQTILFTYMGQILMIAAIAILIGLGVGATTPLILAEMLQNSLPITVNMKIYWKPIILAAFYSGVITLIFTLWPLGQAVATPAARLFRQTVSQRPGPRQSWPYIAAIAILSILLVFGVLYVSEFKEVTAGALAGALIAFLILLGAASLVKKAAKNFPRPKNPIFRIALSNIFRPGNSTTSVVLSLGLGLTLFTTIALIEYNMLKEINGRVGGEAPSFFFIDIQKHQHEDFSNFLTNREGVDTFRTVPNLRGRVTHVKGIESKKVKAKPDGAWILRGDRGVTFTHILPDGNKVIAGEWWDENYDGPSKVSISQQMADSMDLGIGDEITITVLGRSFTLPIASIRSFDWESFGINYVMIVDPKTLKTAPFTYVATAMAKAEHEAAIYRELSQRYPAVSIVRTKEVLDNAISMLSRIAGAIDIMAGITLLSGLLVLAGAIAAGHKTRIYDAAVLKVVGATRIDILKAYLVEFILLGILTGLIALVLGSVAAYFVITAVMEMSWHLVFDIPVITVSGSILATLTFGMVSIWMAMSSKPSAILRNH